MVVTNIIINDTMPIIITKLISLKSSFIMLESIPILFLRPLE